MVAQLIDTFVDKYSTDLSLVLLQILAEPSQGGQGYNLELFNPVVDMDGWEVDKTRKAIQVQTSGLMSNYSNVERAEFLKHAIETEFLETRASLVSRIGWGTGKVVLGTVEGIIGAVGIIVPEPGTTVGGVVMVGLGANTVIDGFTQLAGGNQGNGINLLGTASGYVGAGVADLMNQDPETGRRVGEGAFVVASIVAGSLGSIKILKVPGKAMFARNLGGQPGGIQIGRVDALYKSGRAKDGLTILSINNNTNQSILRFVTHNGQLVVNGRIVGTQNVLRHSTDAKEILKGLLKLMAHGSKF